MLGHTATRLAFQRGGSEKLPNKLGIDSAEGARRPGAKIHCAGCGHPVTSENERISVAGSHEHRFVNPANMEYRIGCFREAAGVIQVANAVSRHTWFPGLAWRITLCIECGGHLGWGFQAGGETRFFGLILKRLAREQ